MADGEGFERLGLIGLDAELAVVDLGVDAEVGIGEDDSTAAVAGQPSGDYAFAGFGVGDGGPHVAAGGFAGSERPPVPRIFDFLGSRARAKWMGVVFSVIEISAEALWIVERNRTKGTCGKRRIESVSPLRYVTLRIDRCRRFCR